MQRMQDDDQAWYFREPTAPSVRRVALPCLFGAAAGFLVNFLPKDVLPGWLTHSFGIFLPAIGLIVVAVGVPIQVIHWRKARAARLQWMQDELDEIRSSCRAA